MNNTINEAIRQWVLQGLPCDPADQALSARLNAMDVHNLLITYQNWVMRQVPAVPRTVFQSAAFAANPRVASRRADIDALIKKIESGHDLRPHLSRRVAIVHDAATKLKRRQDIDLMLNEWEVHHLHISQVIEADGFVQRDDPLLFVMFRGDKAYVLDLMTHHDFNRDHVLEIMTEEWPSAGLVHIVKGVVDLAVHHSEDDRNKLRQAGINSMVIINGKAIKPLGGMSGAGTSVKATMAANDLLVAAEKFEAKLSSDPQYFIDFSTKNGVAWPTNPTFEFGYLPGGGVGVVEESCRLAFKLA